MYVRMGVGKHVAYVWPDGLMERSASKRRSNFIIKIIETVMDTDTIGLITLLIVGGAMLLVAAVRSYWKDPSRNIVEPIETPAAESINRRQP
jgi:hypothetical protein